MRIIAALAIAFVFASHAWGEDEILLVEVSYAINTFDTPSLMASLVAKPPRVFDPDSWPRWQQVWEFEESKPSGRTFTAAPQFVAGFGGCLADRDCQIAMVSGWLDRNVEFKWAWLWDQDDTGPFGFERTTFVPAMETLDGWQLTRITRFIPEAWVIGPGVIDNYYHGYLDQTVRIYGVRVPEPSTAVFILSTVLVHGLTARPPRRFPIPRP